MAIYDPIVDIFSGETAKPYRPDKRNFQMGENPDTASNYASSFGQQAQDYRDRGRAIRQTGVDRAGSTHAPVVDYGAAAEGYAAQQQARSGLMSNADRLNAFADQGPGPSAAEATLANAQNRTMANNLALARSGRGLGGSASAMSTAIDANARAGVENSNNAAILRAQEEQQRRNQELQALGLAQNAYGAARSGDLAARGQEIQMGQFGAGLEMQDRQLDDAFMLGTTNASLGFEGIGQNYDQMGYNALTDQQKANMAYEALLSGNTMAAQQLNIGTDNQRDQANLGLGIAAIGSLAAASDEREKTGKSKVSASDVLIDYGLDLAGVGGAYEAGKQIGQSFASKPEASSIEAPAISYDMSEFGTLPEQQGGGMLGGAMLGSALSDRRSKEKIRELEGERDALAAVLLDSGAAKPRPGGRVQVEVGDAKIEPRYDVEIGPAQIERGYDVEIGEAQIEGERPLGYDFRPAQGYEYAYKDPKAPGAAPGRHYGPMAQDLEKTPAGRAAVRTAPDGTKMVDGTRLALGLTGAVSEQQRRLDELEALLPAEYSGDRKRIDFEREKYGTPVVGASRGGEATEEELGILERLLGPTVRQQAADIADEEYRNIELRRMFRNPPRQDTAL